MAGGKGQGPGKRQVNAVGGLPSWWKDRQEEGGVFLWGRHSLSFGSFHPYPEPGVDSVIAMATDGEREAGRTEVVLPQVAWLVSVRAGIPASVPGPVPRLGHFGKQAPSMAGSRASDGAVALGRRPPRSTRHVPGSSLSSLRSPGLAQRPPGGPGSGVPARP